MMNFIDSISPNYTETDFSQHPAITVQWRQNDPDVKWLVICNTTKGEILVDKRALLFVGRSPDLFPAQTKGRKSSSLLGLTCAVGLERWGSTAATAGGCGDCLLLPRSVGSYCRLRWFVHRLRGVAPRL